LIGNVIANKPDDLEVAAIILHHTLGFVPDTSAIAELGIPVIEDISQSYGSWLKPVDKEKNKNDENPSPKERTETSEVVNHLFGNSQFVILGLEERDMLTSGGGALLFAMNRKDASLLRNFAGIPDEYCLADMNSALAVVQFKDIQRNLDKRFDIAEVFIRSSLRTRHKRFISGNDANYCNYSFSLVLETGLKDVISYAKKKDIILENAFWNTIAGAQLAENCSVSNSLTLRTVLFPLYPRLCSRDVERISRLIMTLP
jgi:dTDP-4-amino-4,6-dideoxygalactose transaminase